MRRSDSTVLHSAAALIVLALHAPIATAAQHRLEALQADETNLLKRDLQRARLEIAERSKPTLAGQQLQRDIALARIRQLQDLEREFQQAPRPSSGAYNAPPQDAAYRAPGGAPPAQPPEWFGYGPGYSGYPGYHSSHWGAPSYCGLLPGLHHRVAPGKPLHAFPAWAVTCLPRQHTHRHWRQARGLVLPH